LFLLDSNERTEHPSLVNQMIRATALKLTYCNQSECFCRINGRRHSARFLCL
jgi:hypothetical protein